MSLYTFRTGRMLHAEPESICQLTGILFLTDSNIVGLQKLSCDHSFRVKYTNFVKNVIIIVNLHHLLPLLVQIVSWMILIVCDLSVSLVSLFRNCLHFFDRSLSLESDF